MDNGEFIYIIIIVAVVLKGIIDVVWKRTAKEAEVLPPFDSRQKPQPMAKQAPVFTETIPDTQPVTEINAPGIKEIKTPSEEPECPPLVQLQDADDLKRAVIYSEILNRKYT